MIVIVDCVGSYIFGRIEWVRKDCCLVVDVCLLFWDLIGCEMIRFGLLGLGYCFGGRWFGWEYVVFVVLGRV